ncbi:MAG: prephenate dehydrogenase/arogenate dehydrogenase family protein [Anaerolineales bacterium]|nr:prephenate dehydrogenase/arogenate dehydrogenase family protein [Anaerolineales bacterium]
MATQITIIGLGQIGASLGLALAERKDSLVRVGHDIDNGIAKQAKKMGAVDKTSRNLYKSIEGSDAVFLALPLDQVEETLALIAGDLQEDSVLLDTAPIKSTVARWAAEQLPPGRHYVGLTPIINPNYLHGVDTGIEGAHGDLFKDGLLAIVTPHGSDSGAVKFATDLAYLIGATPLYVDAAEVDSYMAATHILPQLVAAGLLGTTVDQPGWRDGGKFAGRAYAQVTSPVAFFDPPDAVVSAAVNNPENTKRVLDQMAGYLQELGKAIVSGETEELTRAYKHLNDQRLRWLHMRLAADWEAEGEQVDLPTSSEFFGQILMGRTRKKKKEK